ncbi:PREDICTED: uncharacterized protein LOC106502512 [Capra hircus]|uniref:uncharacterized protein LOC106502512 n=1 Tax=Capra hircus TaxID=9925 RepID=UPI0006B12EC1|nr:PREDICTED: uncharacterized protein LOC106502512 [Capra hircus]
MRTHLHKTVPRRAQRKGALPEEPQLQSPPPDQPPINHHTRPDHTDCCSLSTLRETEYNVCPTPRQITVGHVTVDGIQTAGQDFRLGEYRLYLFYLRSPVPRWQRPSTSGMRDRTRRNRVQISVQKNICKAEEELAELTSSEKA